MSASNIAATAPLMLRRAAWLAISCALALAACGQKTQGPGLGRPPPRGDLPPRVSRARSLLSSPPGPRVSRTRGPAPASRALPLGRLRAARGRARGGAAAAAGSRRRHGGAAAGRPDDRAPRTPRSDPPRAGPGARRRHRAEAPVHRRQRRQGRSGAVPDRSGAAPGRARQRPGDARARPGEPDAGRGAGRALQAAARSERHQQAGLHQRRRRARSRPRPTSRRPTRGAADGRSTSAMPRSPRRFRAASDARW